MELTQLMITYMTRAGFCQNDMDGVRHIKTLPWLSVVQAQQGSYAVQLGSGAVCHVPPGGFFIAPSKLQQTITHHADPVTGVMQCRWIFLGTKADGGRELESLLNFPLTVDEACAKELNALFDSLFAAPTLFDQYSTGYLILKRLCAEAAPTQDEAFSRIQPVLDYIAMHYAENLSVEQLAARISLSPSYFHALFRRSMGVSPIAYLNHFRLSAAAEQLLQTDLPVGEIADRVGIGDPVYFNKMFRKAYLLAPTLYRSAYASRD